MDRRIGSPDSAATTHEPVSVYPVSTLSPDVVPHGYSPPMPSHVPTEVTLQTPTSASYRPRPPHIAIPTSPSKYGAVDNRLDTGAIVGIVLGVLAFVIATGAIVFYLCCRKRLSGGTKKREPRSSWMDLESKNNISDLDSLPSYGEVKAPELGASALYTKYVPRTLGRLSPVSQTVPPTFGLIKEHHLSSDLSTDLKTPPTCNRTRQNVSPGYLNDIELTVTPFDTRFHS